MYYMCSMAEARAIHSNKCYEQHQSRGLNGIHDPIRRISYMGEIDSLIAKLGREQDPLGRPILWKEVPSLITSIKHRFGLEDQDLSPLSLKKLDDKLFLYIQSFRERKQDLTDIEIVQLVREIAAYLGSVLVDYAGGEWYQGALSLWDNRVIIEAPWTIVKERRKSHSSEVNFMISGNAAFSIEEAIEGQKPKLYRIFQDIKKKTIRERYK